MVAGFDDDDQKTCQRTAIYVNGTTKICQSTANYPENVRETSGGSFLKNEKIIVCGGVTMKELATSACYSMSNDLKWTHFANLTTTKAEIATVIVKNGLWVTGNICDKFSSK